MLLSFFVQKNNSDLEKINLKNRIDAYYKNINLGNIDNLDGFININTNRWFDKNNLNLNEIKKQTKLYRNKYPFTETKILWESLKIIPIKNDYLVTYNIVHKVKSDIKSNFNTYYLKIYSTWDHNFKIKSMYEEKIK